MTELAAFDDLVDGLERLGDVLDLDDADIAEVVLERIGTPRPSRLQHRWLVAAAVVLAVMVGVVLNPDSRHAVARWFGLDGLVIEVNPNLSAPEAMIVFEAPGPGQSRVVTVEGRDVLVSAVSGTLSDALITKSVGSSNQVEVVDIDGLEGLWISGSAHQVLYEAANREVVVERFAANTLLWQDNGVLYRVEGFDQLADALAFVEGT